MKESSTSTATKRSPNGATSATGGRRIRGLDASERLEQRRSDLLDAALELFASQGFANTSIEQICQTAYVSTKSFYELFTGKEACFMALYERIMANVASRIEELVAATPPDANRSHALLAAAVHAMVDDPRVARVAYLESMGMSHLLEEGKIEAQNWGALFIADELRRTGFDPDAHHNLEHIGLAVTGGFAALTSEWLRAPEPHDPEDLIAWMTEFYDLVCKGLTADG